ncbi:MAG: hypothetical protein EOP84_36645 [Verrucomicrobiaceae bacterium]|nr:MAG: hypothetical protein EOP84_36645 [Verrucomicrobiaceae bacterium]
MSLASGQFSIAEFATGQINTFPTLGQVTDVRWLSKDRVSVTGAYKQLSIYDHVARKVIADHSLGRQATSIGSVSPDGKTFLLGDRTGIRFLKIETGETTQIEHPVMQGAWASNSELLCSNDATDSGIRGIWLIGTDGKKTKIGNQPMDYDRSNAESVPALEIPGGVLFVIAGDLWRYRSEDGKISQLTNGVSLIPDLVWLAEKQ